MSELYLKQTLPCGGYTCKCVNFCVSVYFYGCGAFVRPGARVKVCVCPFCVCVCLGHLSNPSTSARVEREAILSLPSSACCSAVVFSSLLLFVSVQRPEVKPSVSGSLEIPIPTLLEFPRSYPKLGVSRSQANHLILLICPLHILLKQVDVVLILY